MPESLAQVAGRNARQLRLDAGVTLEQVATTARTFGLPWSSGRVGDFEGGRVAATLSNLYAVALTLTDVTGHSVFLADLFEGEGDVELTDAVTLPLETLRSALRGNVVRSSTPALADVKRAVRWFSARRRRPRQPAESDIRMARSAGDPDIALETMLELWGRFFSEERDRRAGADANAQRKGQISRALKAELREAMGNAVDGGTPPTMQTTYTYVEEPERPVERSTHMEVEGPAVMETAEHWEIDITGAKTKGDNRGND